MFPNNFSHHIISHDIICQLRVEIESVFHTESCHFLKENSEGERGRGVLMLLAWANFNKLQVKLEGGGGGRVT